MRVVATSDLHGHLPDMPECDILIIAGDVCPDRPGNYLAQDRALWQLQWLDTNFRAWLEVQRESIDFIVGIAGNHDFGFEYLMDSKNSGHVEEGTDPLPWTYLRDSGTEIRTGPDSTVKLWGLPWVPNLMSWAFYGDSEKLRQVYEAVPEDTDIVISHGPPKGFRDWTDNKGGGHVGAKQALPMLERVQPQALICGHIHEAFGKEIRIKTPIYNVAYVDEFYIPRYTTVVIDEF